MSLTYFVRCDHLSLQETSVSVIDVINNEIVVVNYSYECVLREVVYK